MGISSRNEWGHTDTKCIFIECQATWLRWRAGIYEKESDGQWEWNDKLDSIIEGLDYMLVF